MRLANIFERVKFLSLLRAIPSFSSNYFNLILNHPDKCAPFYIFWLLSYRCNLKCLHCDWVWSRTGREDVERELDKDKKLDVTEQIARSWTWGVTLSGGEPLIDPALPEIVNRLKSARKFINLCTNGVLLKRFAQELVDRRVDVITVSMDSHKSNVHDAFRGVNGTFDNVISGIEAVMSLRKRKLPRVVVKGVISPHNVNDLSDYVSFFNERVDAIEFQPVQNNFGHQVKEIDVLFKPEHEKAFREAMSRLISSHRQFNNQYYREMADFIFRPGELIRSRRFKCLFPSAMILGIDPYGNAGGCLGRNLIGGNLRDKKLLEIWRGMKNFDSQKKMRCSSAGCICWYNGAQLNSYMLPLYSLFNSRNR